MKKPRLAPCKALVASLQIALSLGPAQPPQSPTTGSLEPPAQSSPWRPETPPKADRDGFVAIRGGVFWGGDIVTRRDTSQLSRVEDFDLSDQGIGSLSPHFRLPW